MSPEFGDWAEFCGLDPQFRTITGSAPVIDQIYKNIYTEIVKVKKISELRLAQKNIFGPEYVLKKIFEHRLKTMAPP